MSEWKPFNIKRTETQSGLFLIENCKCGSASELDDGNDINYVGAKKSDNGVMRSVVIESSLVSKGHGIMFICDGEGSVGYTNYMDKDFIGSTTTSIGYDEAITQLNAMFLVSVLDCERFKYSYGRKYRKHIDEVQIYLPIKHNSNGTIFVDKTYKYSNEGYVPDWQFMEDYIKSLHHKPLTTKNKAGKAPDLNVEKWGEFLLTKVFSYIESGKISNAGDLDEGDDLPYLGAKKSDNGVMQLCVDIPDKRSKGNCVVMICDGEGSVGYANYMESDFLGTVNLVLGYNNEYLNPYTGVFLATIISQERPKYSFGRKWKTHIPETIIKLPVDSNGDPDWQFMEDYIKNLPYGDRLEG